jgi:hypothetical protein
MSLRTSQTFSRLSQTLLYTAAAMGIALSLAAVATAAVRADCIVGITSNQAPSVACRVLSGGEARGRADCIFAPDTYTRWIARPGGAQGSRCWFDARGAILETRSF